MDPPVVKRASDNLHRSIRLPNNVHDAAGRLYRFQLELEARLARSPTDHELAEATGMSVLRIHEGFQLTRMDLSLDVPQNASPSGPPPIELPDEANPSPHDETVNRPVASSIAGARSSLSPREQDIISRRFGLGYPSPQDYAEIAAAHSISRQRAQQIATNAPNLLRLDPPGRRRLPRSQLIPAHRSALPSIFLTVCRPDVTASVCFTVFHLSGYTVSASAVSPYTVSFATVFTFTVTWHPVFPSAVSPPTVFTYTVVLHHRSAFSRFIPNRFYSYRFIDHRLPFSRFTLNRLYFYRCTAQRSTACTVTALTPTVFHLRRITHSRLLSPPLTPATVSTPTVSPSKHCAARPLHFQRACPHGYPTPTAVATATPPVRTAYYAIWWIRWPSVHSPDLARSTSRWRYHRRLKPGQHRAPAHPVRLEFRIVCDKTNRRALNHPNTPGRSPDLVSAAIQAAHRITDRWNEQLIRQDHALEWTSDQTGQPAVYNNVPAEPYGEPTHTAVAHPVQFSDYNLNLATRAAVAHALQLATPYTVVESPNTSYTLEVTSIIGVTASDTPAPVAFHASYGYAEDDPETHLHPPRTAHEVHHRQPGAQAPRQLPPAISPAGNTAADRRTRNHDRRPAHEHALRPDVPPVHHPAGSRVAGSRSDRADHPARNRSRPPRKRNRRYRRAR